MKARGDQLTPDLLDWTPPKVVVGFDEHELRGGELASRISRAVGVALRRCSKSREDVAAEMSDLLRGQRISKATLDAYAAEGKPEHRITLERFIALVHVTGCVDLLGVVVETLDHVVVPARFADIIELHLIEEHEREIVARKAALLARARRRP